MNFYIFSELNLQTIPQKNNKKFTKSEEKMSDQKLNKARNTKPGDEQDQGKQSISSNNSNYQMKTSKRTKVKKIICFLREQTSTNLSMKKTSKCQCLLLAITLWTILSIVASNQALGSVGSSKICLNVQIIRTPTQMF